MYCTLLVGFTSTNALEALTSLQVFFFSHLWVCVLLDMWDVVLSAGGLCRLSSAKLDAACTCSGLYMCGTYYTGRTLQDILYII